MLCSVCKTAMRIRRVRTGTDAEGAPCSTAEYCCVNSKCPAMGKLITVDRPQTNAGAKGETSDA
ncbi:MAG TPA: hypothetical protein PKY19_07740 [Oscillospiraceae bacterium]|nr:hypothetical protein [Oscillospiraceae bacterium]HXK78353.1 hypothetical protein [Oscillospiraceae bacterium]